MENVHIVKSFDQELEQIQNMILEMGGLVETQIGQAIKALVVRDVELAKMVRKEDQSVDFLDTQVHELTMQTLTLRQPLADDLRNVISALKVSSNLERIGDYATNIAKRTEVLATIRTVGTSEKTIQRMGDMVQKMVTDVINAYIKKDVEMADELRLRDEEVDHMHNTLFRELLTYMVENPRNITPCTHMLFIARNLERMGDHATSIAEQIRYAATGAMPEDRRPIGDRTSQMVAEEKD